MAEEQWIVLYANREQRLRIRRRRIRNQVLEDQKI
ncbi:hypothetical protein TcasGA2_TC031852 [Tribolium castaneum]|uniref:Uncharacterized protein n=1 Tax=Tribolium castaneum TaxID=7070 RepID=A0A139W9C4_TRICA|nr:hypothetical protein TcasGA2_TC031852 [Tribolium castaneum]